MTLEEAIGEVEYTALQMSTAVQNNDLDSAYDLFCMLQTQVDDLEYYVDKAMGVI